MIYEIAQVEEILRPTQLLDDLVGSRSVVLVVENHTSLTLKAHYELAHGEFIELPDSEIPPQKAVGENSCNAVVSGQDAFRFRITHLCESGNRKAVMKYKLFQQQPRR